MLKHLKTFKTLFSDRDGQSAFRSHSVVYIMDGENYDNIPPQKGRKLMEIKSDSEDDDMDFRQVMSLQCRSNDDEI